MAKKSFKSILAASLMAIAIPLTMSSAGAGASNGVVTVQSSYSVAGKVSRIKEDVARKGIMLFGVIDQDDLGNATGNTVRPSKLVMFGNPGARHDLHHR